MQRLKLKLYPFTMIATNMNSQVAKHVVHLFQDLRFPPAQLLAPAIVFFALQAGAIEQFAAVVERKVARSCDAGVVVHSLAELL